MSSSATNRSSSQTMLAGARPAAMAQKTQLTPPSSHDPVRRVPCIRDLGMPERTGASHFMHILWMKTELLHPLDKGGRIRTHRMLRHLRREHQITYLCLDDGTSGKAAHAAADDY